MSRIETSEPVVARMKTTPNWLRPWISGALVAALRQRAMALPAIDRKPLLVIVPHQDDETLGCGGLIALKRREGATVGIAFTTDGARSHDGHPLLTPERLVPLRRREALAALDQLGVPESEVHFLDHPDGGLADLAAAEREDLLTSLLSLLERYHPGQICVPFRWDLHPDHETTHALVVEAVHRWGHAVEILEFPIWALFELRSRHLGMAEFTEMRKLDISAMRQLKRRAMLAYQTQIKPTPPWHHGFLPLHFLRTFRGNQELYLSSHPNSVSNVPRATEEQMENDHPKPDDTINKTGTAIRNFPSLPLISAQPTPGPSSAARPPGIKPTTAENRCQISEFFHPHAT